MSQTKYKSKKCVHDCIVFDSKDEMLYYIVLKQRLAEGAVKRFRCQPKLELIPAITLFDGTKQRPVTYTPDFYVEYVSGYRQYVDVKGFSTQQGELRRKLYNWLSVQESSPVYNIPLQWVARNIKHGDADGFIDYDVLQKKRRDSKK